MRRLVRYTVLLTLLASLGACSLEQRLAREFVKHEHPGDFYVLEPSYLFKYNLKEYDIPGIDSLSQYQKDSLLLANSLFLKEITDSLVIRSLVNGITEALRTYKVSVFPEHAVDSLMSNGGRTYVLNLAQFALEEYSHPYKIEEPYYDELIVIDGIDVNAVNYNLWMELGLVNSEDGNRVLFTSDYLFDAVDGVVKQNLVTGEMRFDYTIDTITIGKVYNKAYKFGQKAGYKLYDYLMNNYIDNNIPEGYPYARSYYHYDPVRRLIYAVDEEERLIQVEQ